MKSFLLDDTGDVVIKDGNIQMVSNKDLKVQTMRQVIGTNLGEWFLNKSEGMDFSVLFTKIPNETLIQEAILSAIKQVDESLMITEFSLTREGREASVYFKAQDGAGESYEIEM